MSSRFMKRGVRYFWGLALALVLAVLVQAAPALAYDPGRVTHPILGVVPARGRAISPLRLTTNLTYHNGPTMHTNAAYVIYWAPSGYSFSPTYQSLVNRFFADVAADNGKTSNVYYSDTQYYDNVNGNILYNSSFSSANAVLDTNSFPPSGCSLYASYVSVCLTDAQLQTEIQNVMSAHGWSGGENNLFFMLTASGVGSCAGSSCAFTYYCAYHSWIGSGSGAILYANMPYAGTNLAACGATQSPNGDVNADSEINIISHEHNETITDEQGSAWYDRRGYENGDKCAWNFGSVSLDGNQANQQINTHYYILQQEWSNKTGRCVLTGY